MRHFFLLVLGAILFLAFTAQADSQGKKKPKPPIWSDQKDAFGDPLPIGAIARIGTVRYRLPDARGPALPSPDGTIIAVAGENEIEIWQLPAWKRQRVLTVRGKDQGPPSQFQAMAFSADGKKLAACDTNSMRILLFDLDAPKALARKISFPKQGQGAPVNPFLLMLSSDEKTLVCISLDNQGNGNHGQVVVWDLLAKEKVRTSFGMPADLSGNRPNVCVSADCRWLAQNVTTENPNRPGQGVDSRIELWDLSTGKLARKIDLEMPMQRLALSPDGKWLAASNESSLLRIYDAATGKEQHNIRGRSPIGHLQFAADGALYAGDYLGNIQRWDAAAGERTSSWKAPVRAPVTQLLFPPRGKMLALSMGADAVHFWEVETGKLFSPKDLPADPISEVEFSPQGELFVASEGGMTAWWDPRTGRKLRDLKLESLDGEERGPIVRFDIYERRAFGPRRGNPGPGALFGLSPNGEFLVNSNGDSVTFFDAKTGKALYEEDTIRNSGLPADIAFLEGGAKSASMTNKKVRIWNTRTGRDVASFTIPLRDQEISSRLAASASGKHFAVQLASQAENGGVRMVLFDVDKKKILREWPTQNGVDALVFSTDGQWLAAARPQERVQLTRVGAARADYELGPKDGSDFSQVAFSPDSRQLACASLTTTDNGGNSSRILIFELASKKIRLELVGHPAGIIERLAWSPDSGLLASGATDTTALLWKAGLKAFASKPLAEDADLAPLFTQLAGSDAKSAFQGMIQFARSPSQTVKLLEDKIAPAKKPDSGDKSVPQWIHDLGSGQFALRSKANLMLQKIGPAAEPELRIALANVKDIETRRRIEELLDRINLHELTAEEILHVRAVELLDAIGTPEARTLLRRWATGDPAAILTIEARKALAPAPPRSSKASVLLRPGPAAA